MRYSRGKGVDLFLGIRLEVVTYRRQTRGGGKK